MKRLYQLLVGAAVAILVPMAASVPASAANTCEVGFTGPNSQNMCTSVETYSCSVTNQNNVIITNSSNQQVASGSVTVSGNGAGGNGTSGSVTNTDGTTFSVTITNSNPTTQGSGTCTATVTVPATETEETVTPASTEKPKALPVTSGDKTLVGLMIASGIAALIAGAAVAVALYRRSHIL
ncbi:MAG: hypothetical protein ACREGE_04600 [Candidatus Microsaccharimonas sp.]